MDSLLAILQAQDVSSRVITLMSLAKLGEKIPNGELRIVFNNGEVTFVQADIKTQVTGEARERALSELKTLLAR